MIAIVYTDIAPKSRETIYLPYLGTHRKFHVSGSSCVWLMQLTFT